MYLQGLLSSLPLSKLDGWSLVLLPILFQLSLPCWPENQGHHPFYSPPAKRKEAKSCIDTLSLGTSLGLSHLSHTEQFQSEHTKRPLVEFYITFSTEFIHYPPKTIFGLFQDQKSQISSKFS